MFLDDVRSRAFDNLDITGYEPDIKGWKYDSFDSIFEEAVKKYKDPTIIEVGSWKGLSATTMAKICKKLDIAPKIVCIDTWLGSREFWLSDATDDMGLNFVNGYPSIFYTFTKNVKSLGHHDCIYPIPCCSDQGSQIQRHYDIMADMIYVDASHDYKSVHRDLTYFWNNLKSGGIMFGDDYNGNSWPGVVRAVNEFATEMNVHVYVSNGVWYFYKV
jgi:hypothetical protein